MEFIEKRRGVYRRSANSNGGAVAEKESLTPQNIETERLMMGLRLADGIAFSENEITEKIKAQIDAGFLEHIVCNMDRCRYKGNASGDAPLGLLRGFACSTRFLAKAYGDIKNRRTVTGRMGTAR